MAFRCSLSFLLLMFAFVTLCLITPVSAKQDKEACRYFCGLDCGDLTDCEVEQAGTFSIRCRCVPQAGPIAGIVIAIIVISVSACIACCWCGRCCCFSYRRAQLAIPVGQTTIITSQQPQQQLQGGYVQYPAQPVPYQGQQAYPVQGYPVQQGTYPQGYMQAAVPMEGQQQGTYPPQGQVAYPPPTYNPYGQQQQQQQPAYATGAPPAGNPAPYAPPTNTTAQPTPVI